jgi:hypothetical protein
MRKLTYENITTLTRQTGNNKDLLFLQRVDLCHNLTASTIVDTNVLYFLLSKQNIQDGY